MLYVPVLGIVVCLYMNHHGFWYDVTTVLYYTVLCVCSFEKGRKKEKRMFDDKVGVVCDGLLQYLYMVRRVIISIIL